VIARAGITAKLERELRADGPRCEAIVQGKKSPRSLVSTRPCPFSARIGSRYCGNHQYLGAAK
jgi:hypothetical protein